MALNDNVPPFPVVLIIDDSEEDLFLLARDMQLRNFTPITARDCESGVNIIINTFPRPKLVIIDMVMPGVDGYACLRMIKKDPRTTLIPVVAITGMLIPTDREHIMAAGFAGYYEKPIRPKEMVNELWNMIHPLPELK